MSKKPFNVVPAIKAIEDQISEINHRYRQEVAPYEASLKELRKINEACENCYGEGKVLRTRACAEDDRPDPDDPSDYIICPCCHGTGRSKKD